MKRINTSKDIVMNKWLWIFIFFIIFMACFKEFGALWQISIQIIMVFIFVICWEKKLNNKKLVCVWEEKREEREWSSCNNSYILQNIRIHVYYLFGLKIIITFLISN